MELLKKKIHMNRLKCRGVSQISLEEDFNVPDSKWERLWSPQGKSEWRI